MSATLTREEFDQLPIEAKPSFFKDGGKLVHSGGNSTAIDVLAKQLESDERPGKLITREEYEAMTLKERGAFFQSGGRIGGPNTIREIAKRYGHSEEVVAFVIKEGMHPEKFRAWCITKALARK